MHPPALRREGQRLGRVGLLGVYLGDGCISRGPHGQAILRIACANAWSGLLDAACRTMASIAPYRIFRIEEDGCTSVEGHWKHWLCLFPQHGPGKKHERAIVIADWQRELVDIDPRPLLRGLFHSDGCRCVNRVRDPRSLSRWPRRRAWRSSTRSSGQSHDRESGMSFMIRYASSCA